MKLGHFLHLWSVLLPSLNIMAVHLIILSYIEVLWGISFCVNKVCQFISNPLDTHWKVVKRISCYLKGTSGYGLSFVKSPTS